MECFTWAELANIHLAYSAAYSNGREAWCLSQAFSKTVCVKIIVHLLLSTVACGKLIHLQRTGPAGGKDNQLAFFSLHISTCCTVVGRVSRLVAVRLNICSFRLNFGILKWFRLISNLSQTHFDGTWHSQNTSRI